MERIETRPAAAVIGDVRGWLLELVSELEPAWAPHEAAGGRGRPRIVPALSLWGAVVLSVLEGDQHQRDVWRRISDTGVWDQRRYQVSDQAVYKRLAEGGTAPLEQLFSQVSSLLAPRLVPYADRTLAPFASDVLALDETTLDPLARLLEPLRPLPPGDRALLPGKLTGLYDLRTQQWRRIEQQPCPTQNEKVAARDMLEGLAPGTLLLFDLGYFAFQWFDDLTAAGHSWISRERGRTSCEVVHTSYADGDTRDELVWLGAYRADRSQHLVRRVQFRHGTQRRVYLSNVLDPALLSIAEIARLYARRWDFELAVKLVKRELGLALWWGANAVVIQQQLWAVLLIAQLIQAVRLEIAGRAGVEVFDVSIHHLVERLPVYLALGLDPVATVVERGRAMGYIRPHRRVRVVAPDPDRAAYRPVPPDLPTERRPRYAHRRSTPRPAPAI